MASQQPLAAPIYSEIWRSGEIGRELQSIRGFELEKVQNSLTQASDTAFVPSTEP